MTEVLQPDWLELTVDGADEMAVGLRGYVALVAAALGVGLESCSIDTHPAASAYIALDSRLARFPQRDLALLWDDRHGWSAAVETHSGEDLIVVAYRGGDLVPSPAAVQVFIHDLLAGLPVGQPGPPAPIGHGDTLARRLGAYAMVN